MGMYFFDFCLVMIIFVRKRLHMLGFTYNKMSQN